MTIVTSVITIQRTAKMQCIETKYKSFAAKNTAKKRYRKYC